MDNTVTDPLREVVEILGLQPTATICEVSYVAVSKWLKQGLPRSEWTGETDYCKRLQKATRGEVRRADMLRFHAELRSSQKASRKAAKANTEDTPAQCARAAGE